MKKLLCYSLYISDRRSPNFYFQGLIQNLNRAKTLYPDYEVYVYLQDKLIEVKPILENNGAQVFVRNNNANNHIPALWRYHPLIEENFDIVLFRDADSLLFKRERDLVTLFENSNYNFHIIRDHPHHTMKILAGMWGAKKTTPEIKKIINDCYNLDGVYSFEEKHFQNYLYDLIKNETLEHDSNKTPDVFNTYPNEGFIGGPYA